MNQSQQTRANDQVQGRLDRRQFIKQTAATTLLTGMGQAVLTQSANAENQDNSASNPVIDTHMHVWSDGKPPYPFAHPYNADAADPAFPASVEMLLADMDANNVTHSIIVQTLCHGWDNTYVAACLKKHPSRFRAHGLIDPTDPHVADKLEYWMTEHNFSGMRFSAIYYIGKDDWLTSAAHHKLWKKAIDLKAVFNFYIATHQLPTLEQMVAKYPAMPIIVDHISQIDLTKPNAAMEMKKLLRLSKYPNVYVKVAELTSVSPSGKYPFQDTWTWLKMVYDAFGPDRLLWGTGYPGSARAAAKRPTLAKELDLIRKEIPIFSPEDQAKILGLNAARLWRIKAT